MEHYVASFVKQSKMMRNGSNLFHRLLQRKEKGFNSIAKYYISNIIRWLNANTFVYTPRVSHTRHERWVLWRTIPTLPSPTVDYNLRGYTTNENRVCNFLIRTHTLARLHERTFGVWRTARAHNSTPQRWPQQKLAFFFIFEVKKSVFFPNLKRSNDGDEAEIIKVTTV